MGKKIVCESCGTEFQFEIAKDFTVCPVCGVSFDDGEDNIDNDNSVQDDGLMYFNEILIYNDEPNLSNVCVYCSECGKVISLELDNFDKLVDKEYVILNNNIELICRGCGKEHKPRKILYRKKSNNAPPRPHCPACNSIMLKKISTGSKFLAAATGGMFAIPYNSKTFECMNCGYRF